MARKFDRVGLVDIGGTVLDAPDRQKAKLVVQFDAGGDHFPRVEISLTVNKSLESRLRDLNEEARLSAIDMLKQTLITLEGNALHELEELSRRQDAEMDAELEAQMLLSIDEKLISISD